MMNHEMLIVIEGKIFFEFEDKQFEGEILLFQAINPLQKKRQRLC